MIDLNNLFRKRIGMDEYEEITFEKLDGLLERMATSIPFENLCIISNKLRNITKENLINKILVENEGGLCYELNSILYLFLLENGFNVKLVTGIVFNHSSKDWSRTGRTHVTILLTEAEKTYLVDTGFGGNLPLKPVPLTGEVVISRNGEFRVRFVDSNEGNYILEMTLKHKDHEWKTGYVFDSEKPVQNLSDLNIIQKLISESPYSGFNKNPLLTRLTSNGNMTLTDTSFTKWSEGKSTKEVVDDIRFKELAKQYFQIGE